LPALARHRVFSGNRDQWRKFHAATIVSVGSVDFAPYIRLLLGSVNGVTVVDHLVVITDGDPDPNAVEDADDSTVRNRASKLAGIAEELGAGRRLTVAAATYTLEADLLAGEANASVLQAAYLVQHPQSHAKWQHIADAADPARALYQALRKDKGFISKGEFAHHVALAIRDGAAFSVPAYLRNAITAALDGPGESDATAE
jgi:putative ATP-dependent endonuclease of OLD family